MLKDTKHQLADQAGSEHKLCTTQSRTLWTPKASNKIITAYITPKLLYGIEAAPLNKGKMEQIQVFYRGMLQSIQGLTNIIWHQPACTYLLTLAQASVEAVWKQHCHNTLVLYYKLLISATGKSSLLWISHSFLKLEKCHPIWETCPKSVHHIQATTVRVRLLTGRYSVYKT